MKSPTVSNLFVYGSLMNEEVLNSLVTGHFNRQSAILKGYRRVHVLRATYPAIFADQNAEVEGLVITNINSNQLAQLDDFEGEFYCRSPVTIKPVSGGDLNCDTYIFKSEYQHMLSDQPWCNQVFRRKHMSDFLREHTQSH